MLRLHGPTFGSVSLAADVGWATHRQVPLTHGMCRAVTCHNIKKNKEKGHEDGCPFSNNNNSKVKIQGGEKLGAHLRCVPSSQGSRKAESDIADKELIR